MENENEYKNEKEDRVKKMIKELMMGNLTKIFENDREEMHKYIAGQEMYWQAVYSTLDQFKDQD